MIAPVALLRALLGFHPLEVTFNCGEEYGGQRKIGGGGGQ